tara:strand:+ start:1011 stop:1265 length:255 start_codon:yes stop_codon:yes gene_type:complete
MNQRKVKIEWPNGNITFAEVGNDWLEIASKSGINIPTGCLTGSCGACEIEVNGEIVRACISRIPDINSNLKVDFLEDPFWGEIL